MSAKLYVGVSNDNSFSILFRPYLDIYPDFENKEVHLCYLDIEGLKQENENFQQEFYTDFVVESAKDIKKILSDYRFFSVPGEEEISKTTPVALDSVMVNVRRRFAEMENEIKQVMLRDSFPGYFARKEAQTEAKEVENDLELD